MEFAISESVTEFIAVVLAGFGNDLAPLTNPLTSDLGEQPCPKALLPIANKPMLDYPLAWLEQSGITKVILICPSPHKDAISHYVDSASSFPSLQIDLQAFDEEPLEPVGTTQLLRHYASKITHDFVLLPCDFVPPASLPLSLLLNRYRAESASDGAIGTACFFESPKPEKGSFVDEWGVQEKRLPIVYDDKTGTLLHVETEDDYDRNSDEVEIRMSLLAKYPRTKCSSLFQDSHVYVCRRSVLDALVQKPQLDSIREEFIPWLCKVQYQRTRRQKYGKVLAPITNATSNVALQHSTLHTPTFDSSYKPNQDDDDDDSDSDTKQTETSSLRLGLVLHRHSAGYTARANKLHTYLELNRHFLGQTPYTLPIEPTERALIDAKSQIASDSLVGQSTRVEERASVKRSVVGRHCHIGKNAKVVGCVLLDHCVVAEGAKLDGCILGMNTKVGAKAELVRCVTQAGYEVEANETLRHSKLETSDWAAAPTSSGDEDSGEETESAAGTGTGTATDSAETSEDEDD